MLLAVDGGATKTIAVVYDSSIIGVGVAGSGNYNNVGVKEARENTGRAVSEAISMASCDWKDIDRAIYGFAGVENSASTTKAVEAFLRSLHRNGKFTLFNDGVAAYYLSTRGRPGVVAAAGTGSVVQARNGERTVRTGGWGWLAGDEGGAFYIARRGLQEAAKSFDGRNSDTMLVHAFENACGGDFQAAVNRIYTSFAVNTVASYAPVVTACALKGDRIALEVCREAAAELAAAVKAAVRRVAFSGEFIIGGLGGVFRAGSVITDTFRSELSEESGIFARTFYGYHVVLGSIMLDMKNRGYEPGEKDVEKLVSEMDSKLLGVPEQERKKFLFMD